MLCVDERVRCVPRRGRGDGEGLVAGLEGLCAQAGGVEAGHEGVRHSFVWPSRFGAPGPKEAQARTVENGDRPTEIDG